MKLIIIFLFFLSLLISISGKSVPASEIMDEMKEILPFLEKYKVNLAELYTDYIKDSKWNVTEIDQTNLKEYGNLVGDDKKKDND
uniref:Peptidase S41 n=1 Tax=Parastrongyloides trichosuri TaxID=131310 RepID=A0A0N5A2Z5_PARTI